MNRDQVTTIGVGVVVGGVALFVAYNIWRQASAPKEQDTTVLDVGGLLTADNSWQSTGEHYVDPNSFTGPTTVTQVRYPSIAGVNLSALALHGWAPLRKQMPSDFDYLNAPPSEE